MLEFRKLDKMAESKITIWGKTISFSGGAALGF